MRKVLWLVVTWCLSSSSFAAINQSAVDKVSRYLDSLTTFVADFSQTNINGYITEGKLLIQKKAKKPANFRCNYYEPYPLVITGNSRYIAIYDYEMEQLTKIPVEDSGFALSALLLSDKAALQKNFKIISASEDDKFIKLTAQPLEHEFKTEITLDKEKSELCGLKITEANGYSIDLSISNVLAVEHIDEKLFTIKNPEIFGKPLRLNRKNIIKHYCK